MSIFAQISFKNEQIQSHPGVCPKGYTIRETLREARWRLGEDYKGLNMEATITGIVSTTYTWYV
jgi:hypothetical protein